MTNVVDFTRKMADRNRLQNDQKALETLARAIRDKRLSREDLQVLALILTERPQDGSVSAYLSNGAVAKSCAKFVAVGLFVSDSPYECIAPSGVSAGWFQSFQFVEKGA